MYYCYMRFKFNKKLNGTQAGAQLIDCSTVI